MRYLGATVPRYSLECPMQFVAWDIVKFYAQAMKRGSVILSLLERTLVGLAVALALIAFLAAGTIVFEALVHS